ncbi:hypothetical protein BYT27DRAFT_7193533 [Phlegmacium glaucopus]|nr:hypothetical protein BYT27DRAFT_7193533 [Phlegmacium glaucopus]
MVLDTILLSLVRIALRCTVEDGGCHFSRNEDTSDPQTVFDTELCIAVPLPFLLNKNLQIITDKDCHSPYLATRPQSGRAPGSSSHQHSQGHGADLIITHWDNDAPNSPLPRKQGACGRVAKRRKRS